MIIFYNKDTGEIFGTIDGRVHDDFQLKKALICPVGFDEKKVGKYVVPFKPRYIEVEKLKVKYILPDENKPAVKQIVVGKKKIKVKEISGMIPDVPFAKEISRLEKKSSDIYQYKLKLNDEGEVIDLKKR